MNDNTVINKTVAVVIVDELIEDLTDRRGLRQGWESVDSGVKEEIKKKWVEIIMVERI